MTTPQETPRTDAVYADMVGTQKLPDLWALARTLERSLARVEADLRDAISMLERFDHCMTPPNCDYQPTQIFSKTDQTILDNRDLLSRLREGR